MANFNGQQVRLRIGDRIQITVAKDCNCDCGAHPLDKAGLHLGTVVDVGDNDIYWPRNPLVQLDREFSRVEVLNSDHSIEILARAA